MPATPTRFSVAPLHTMTRALAAVAMGRAAPDLVLTGARVLSTYTERIHRNREIWIKGGRVAAVKPAGTATRLGLAPRGRRHDVAGGIIAPGLVDPHVHIESSMMTACAFAEAALRNGTTTVFCDSHEIGNVCDTAGVEWMLEDARRAPLSVYLTVPSTVPATNDSLETAGGDLTPAKIGRLFDRWPEAVALGEKMDYVAVASGDERSHAILAQALRRGRPVCGHIYGREFVAAGAASGITDTHEAIDRDIADEFLENGLWIFLRGGNPSTPWHSLPQAIRTVTELGANPKRVCVCTDDRDADDLFLFGLDWVVRQARAAGLKRETAWSCGSLHPATRYGLDGDFGGLGPGRRADLVLLNDDLEPRSTWYGGELVIRDRQVTPILERALSRRYRYPKAAYRTVKLPRRARLPPDLPKTAVSANVIRLVPPGILTAHETAPLARRPGSVRAGRAEEQRVGTGRGLQPGAGAADEGGHVGDGRL
ncbi:MAG: amidohydrolase family protein, partial [Opitutaceae bacterium]